MSRAIPTILSCPVCHSSNHHLAIVCTSCGSFLQDRIENLDLFSTLWGIIEKPLRAFHFVAIARHKNYGLVLSSLGGIALTFFTFWLIKAGDYAESLLNLLGAGLTVSIPFGIFCVCFVAGLITAIGNFLNMHIKYRNAFAVVAYSLIPLVFSVILILPIEILTFGQFFFTSNPSPYLLKPTSYILFLGLDTLFGIWSLGLLFVGIRTLAGGGRGKILLLFGSTLGILLTLAVETLQFVIHGIR